MDDRISLRFNGKLLSLRMEDANLENIDRVAKSLGMSRSEWMRLAMLTQLAVDLAMIGAPEPVDNMCHVEPSPHVPPPDVVFSEPVQFGAPVEPEPAEMVGAWAPPEPEPEVEVRVERPNKWA